MRFAAAIIRIAEEDKVVLVLELVGTCTVAGPSPLRQECIVNNWDEAEDDHLCHEESGQHARELQPRPSSRTTKRGWLDGFPKPSREQSSLIEYVFAVSLLSLAVASYIVM